MVGRPNVGKSTLVNALVGRKISIVTPRAQTTRHAILGVLTRPDAQLLFVDTPGLHTRQRNMLNQAMNRAADSAMAGADLVMFVVEAGVWRSADDYVLEHVRNAGYSGAAGRQQDGLGAAEVRLAAVSRAVRRQGRISPASFRYLLRASITSTG